MNRNDIIVTLSRGLNQDLLAYRRLKEQLEAEFDAAMYHDSSRLAAISEVVENLAGEIEIRRQERVDLVAWLFGDDKNARMEQVFSLLPEAPSKMFRAWWSELEGLVHDCKTQNARLCRLLTDQHEIMQRILGDQEDIYAPA